MIIFLNIKKKNFSWLTFIHCNLDSLKAIYFFCRSSILFGHVDKGITPGLTEIKHQTNPVNQTIAHFHVTPTSLGKKNVCFQTRDSTS